jgi:glycosyltransferase involved in cell wall biosynthesis
MKEEWKVMYYRTENEIIKSWNKENKTPLLSVICITYGQEQYIEQAIDSILEQRTNFRFEVIIGEDCSPDNTKNILLEYQKNYPNIIKIILRDTNIGSSNNSVDCISQAKGKYIALLEGDDFWVNELKLQKQVDFLNKNTDYGLVHGDTNHLYEDTGIIIPAYNKTNNIKVPNGEIYNKLLEPSHLVKTMTVCFRKDLFEKYYLSNKSIMNSNWKLIDISIWLMFAQYSKIHYFNEVFSTYRLLPESMSRTSDLGKFYKFHEKIIQIRFFYLRNFISTPLVREKIFKWYYQGMLTYGYNLKNKRLVVRGKIGLNRLGYKLNTKEQIKNLLSYFFK